MSRLSLVFWIVAGLDAALLVALLVSFLRTSMHSDGGREMAIFFFVVVPGVSLAAAMLLHALVDSAVARGIALFVVVVPGLLFAGDRLRDRWIDHRIDAQRSGAGFFAGAAMREMGRAVVRRDVETLRRIGSTIDVNASGERGMTLLRLAVEGDFASADDASGDETGVVRALLALGAKLDSALPAAARRDDPAMLRLLLDAGAVPQAISSDDRSPVFEWIDTMTPTALRLLLDHGLDPDLRSRGDPLAVHATIHRRWDLLAVLIAAGVDTHRARADGRDVAGELAAQTAIATTDGRTAPPDLLRATALMRSITTPSNRSDR